MEKAEDAELDPSGLSLVVMGTGAAFARPLPMNGEVSVGRDDECDVVLDDPKVSRCHVAIRVEDGALTVIDKGSRNGSWLGARKLDANESRPIELGDVIRIGATVLLVKRDGSARTRTRHFGVSSLASRAEEARAAGEAHAVFDLALKVAENPGATWAEEDAVQRDKMDRVDVAIHEALGEEAAVAEPAPDRRRVIVFEPLSAAHVRMGAILSALRDAGVEVSLSPVAGDDIDRLPKWSLVPPSTGMPHVWALVDRVAAGNINVLLLGETGVGKEVMARAIHARSPRATAGIVTINCGALAENLLESELFGHERGAFTGAARDKAGLLESVNGGVVFLDEVGEMPLPLQVKLLRVLEQREVLRVGSLRPRPIDVRFLSATNRDLESESNAGRFRRDLYFRLNGITVTIPPLRERADEIESLARGFMSDVCAASARVAPQLPPETVEAMRAHDWPGNIRELRNVVERALLLCRGDALLPHHLRLPARGGLGAAGPRSSAPDLADPEDAEERGRVLAALEQCAGNQTHAAKMLGISRGTLIARLARFNVPRPRGKRI